MDETFEEMIKDFSNIKQQNMIMMASLKTVVQLTYSMEKSNESGKISIDLILLIREMLCERISEVNALRVKAMKYEEN